MIANRRGLLMLVIGMTVFFGCVSSLFAGLFHGKVLTVVGGMLMLYVLMSGTILRDMGHNYPLFHGVVFLNGLWLLVPLEYYNAGALFMCIWAGGCLALSATLIMRGIARERQEAQADIVQAILCGSGVSHPLSSPPLRITANGIRGNPREVAVFFVFVTVAAGFLFSSLSQVLTSRILTIIGGMLFLYAALSVLLPILGYNFFIYNGFVVLNGLWLLLPLAYQDATVLFMRLWAAGCLTMSTASIALGVAREKKRLESKHFFDLPR